MFPPRNLTLHQKLRLGLMTVSTVAVLLACATFIVFSLILSRRAAVRDGTCLARVIANNCQAALAFDVPDDATKILGALRDTPAVTSAVIYRPGGERFAAYPPNAAADTPPPPDDRPGHRFARHALLISLPILLDDRPVGVLHIENDLRNVRQALRQQAAATGLALALALGAAYLLSRRLSRVIATPIVTLTETARSVSEDADYAVRAPDTGSDDEVGILTHAFNRMLAVIAERDVAVRAEVSIRRRAEELLRVLNATLEQRVAVRTRDLERSNQDLQQFAFSASHDLQEPLRKVMAFGSLLEAKAGDTLRGENRTYLASMLAATARMQQLINGLLSYSRVTTRESAFVAVDLDTVVGGVLSDLETNIREAGATIDVARMPTITADPTQMRQLLQNLLGNAIKFRHDGNHPHVTIHADAIALDGDAAQAPTHVRLTVTDDGIGFDEKYAERIFGVFQRLHLRHEYSGSGIGLAVCRRIVERHNGTIVAKSTPGVGSSFIVTLPVTQPAEMKEMQP